MDPCEIYCNLFAFVMAGAFFTCVAFENPLPFFAALLALGVLGSAFGLGKK